MIDLSRRGSGAPRRRGWRKAAAAGAALAMGLVSTVVFAEWLANGNGEGYVQATVAEPLTTESVSVTESLYPGGTADLVLRIANPNPFPVTVTSITQDGPITSDDAECDSGGHGVTFAPQTVSLAVPAGSAQTFTLADSVSMALTSADACQGALFTVPVSLNGGSSDGGGGGGEPVDCDDADPNTVDSFDEASGTCVNTTLECNDGNPFTTDEVVDGTCVFTTLPDGTVCDDHNPETILDHLENGLCTGQPAPTYYADDDGDGYGDEASSILGETSSPPDGYADNPDDCDDASPQVHPGAIEILDNGVDDDCDGIVE